MKDKLTKKPRERWFAAPCKSWEEGWFGPHSTIEAAIWDCYANCEIKGSIFVAKGHKLRKDEQYSEFEWEVQTEMSIEVKI